MSCSRLSPVFDVILNNCGVLPLHHENSFLNLDSLDLESEDRKGIKAELFQVTKALGVYGAWIAIRAEIKGTPANNDGFFQLGEEHKTPDGWLGCRD